MEKLFPILYQLLDSSKIFPLSHDFKPDLTNERKRIYEYGGIVRRAFDDIDEYLKDTKIKKEKKKMESDHGSEMDEESQNENNKKGIKLDEDEEEDEI